MIARMFKYQAASTAGGVTGVFLQLDRVEDEVGPDDLDVAAKHASVADGQLGVVGIQVLHWIYSQVI